MEWKLDNGWKDMAPLNSISVHGQSKLFKFCEKTLPYYLPFINLRQRVKCRRYFRYNWWNKCEKELVDCLSKCTAHPIEWDKVSKQLDEIEYWTIQKNASV